MTASSTSPGIMVLIVGPEPDLSRLAAGHSPHIDPLVTLSLGSSLSPLREGELLHEDPLSGLDRIEPGPLTFRFAIEDAAPLYIVDIIDIRSGSDSIVGSRHARGGYPDRPRDVRKRPPKVLGSKGSKGRR